MFNENVENVKQLCKSSSFSKNYRSTNILQNGISMGFIDPG